MTASDAFSGSSVGRKTTADVVVLGSGVAGLTTALVAALSGLSVVLLEKTGLVGGATAYAAGGAFLPGSHHLPPDDLDEVFRYLRHCTNGKLDPKIIGAYLRQGPEALRFLEDNTAVLFQGHAGMDYRADAPGARRYRTVGPVPYDGRGLGTALKLVRPPLPTMTIFGGMQVDYADIAHLLKATRSVKEMSYAARLIARHLVGRIRHGRSPRLVFGNALVGRLLKSVLDHPQAIELRLNSPVVELLLDDGRVTGVVYESGGETHRVDAKKGVMLASGGFPGDVSMRSERTPYAGEHLSLPPPTNVGDGIRMALAAGARLSDRALNDYCYTPVSRVRRADGKDYLFPHFGFDRCYPGAIAVGPDGRRFVNEAIVYSDFVPAMHAAGAVPAYLICDHKFLRKYGLGIARPSPFPYRALIKQGYLTRAASLDDLARQLGISPTGLADTVDRNNAYAATGVDLDFRKGGDDYSRSMGDPKHQPNPCLGRIGKGPYYAVRLFPGETATTRGLEVDEHARVLDGDDEPIVGLYAAGPDMANPTLGTNPSGGCNIGPGLAFGYIAARDMAMRQSDPRSYRDPAVTQESERAARATNEQRA